MHVRIQVCGMHATYAVLAHGYTEFCNPQYLVRTCVFASIKHAVLYCNILTLKSVVGITSLNFALEILYTQ